MLINKACPYSHAGSGRRNGDDLVERNLKQTRDYARQVVARLANGLLSISSDRRIAPYNLLTLELLNMNESEAKGMDLKSVIDFKKTGEAILFMPLSKLHSKSFVQKGCPENWMLLN